MKPLNLVDDRPEADEAAERILAAPFARRGNAVLVARAYLMLRAAPAPATGDLVRRLRDEAGKWNATEGERRMAALLREAADTLEKG